METYIVQYGDTIDSVAKKYNVNPGDIINANNIMPPYILVDGQTLMIPISNSNIFDYYTVKKNDTLYNIALSANTTIDMLSAINGIKPNEYIYPGQTLLIPKKGIKTYITGQGDSLSSVAKYFNTNPQQLLKNNQSIYLLPDQLLIIRSY